MPTPNPRLSVTLKPEFAAILTQLSRVTGNSQSAIVAELLEECMPTLAKMIRVIEAAKTVQEDGRQKIAKSMQEAQDRLHEQLGIVNDLFDAEALPILEQAEVIERRTRRAPAVRRGGPHSVGGSPTVGRSAPVERSADPRALTGGSGSRNSLIRKAVPKSRRGK